MSDSSTCRTSRTAGKGADEGEREGAAGREPRLGVVRAAQRTRARVRRAKEHVGHERDVVLLLAKSALACLVSWCLAEYAVHSAQPTYAPFTALLIVQSTVYRTLWQSVRYVVAVIFGILAARFAGPLLGFNAFAFAVMIVVVLLIGRWHRLGSQGIQVPTAGIFAYNAFSGTQTPLIWTIVGMVLLGAAVGIVVNLVLLPPMHYRTASEGVRELSSAVCALLRDIAAGLREGVPTRDTTEDWARRARELDATVSRARYAVEHGAESISYNPRRLLRRSAPPGFSGYRTMVEALARAVEQVRSIAAGLSRTLHDDMPSPDEELLCSYAELLDLVAESVQCAGDPADGARESLGRCLETGAQRYEQLAEEIRDHAAWPTLGALLIDAHRLLEEFSRAHDRGAVQPV